MGQQFDNLESTVLLEVYIKRISSNHVFFFRTLSLYVCLCVNTCCLQYMSISTSRWRAFILKSDWTMKDFQDWSQSASVIIPLHQADTILKTKWQEIDRVKVTAWFPQSRYEDQFPCKKIQSSESLFVCLCITPPSRWERIRMVRSNRVARKRPARGHSRNRPLTMLFWSGVFICWKYI